MGFLKRFCYCCNVRQGSIFSGFYSTIYSLIYVGLLFFRYVGFDYLTSSRTYSVLVYASVVIFGCHAICSLIVVLGICTDSVMFLFPFLFTAVVCMVHAAITICLVFIKELKDHGEVGVWEACTSVYHIINIVITFYCLICVFSQTQDFMRGKGTARYYRRRRSRRRRRAAMILEAMELGQQPPPLPFPFDELYNALTPYPVPGPVIDPPSYVDKPPPYSTLPRPETTRQTVGDPHEPEAGTSGAAAPEVGDGACAAPPYSSGACADVAALEGGACAAPPYTSGACADVAAPEVGVGACAAPPYSSGACADVADETRSCCELGACGCHSGSVYPINTGGGTSRTEIETGHELRHGECDIRSRDDELYGACASRASERRRSSDAGAPTPVGVPHATQTAFIIAQEYPALEWDHHEGVVATCDSITHI